MTCMQQEKDKINEMFQQYLVTRILITQFVSLIKKLQTHKLDRTVSYVLPIFMSRL